MVMSPELEVVLERAIRLGPRERLQLIERLASSVEQDIGSTPSTETAPPVHWGKALNALMDEIGPIELVDPEITDPVEWVKAQREKDAVKRSASWDLKE